ncbi:DUF3955 domain-containing protein [Tritonibacter mobilis]|nr:DUF3955 domain-containing protein [Tritonibacter mobilis]
MLTKLQLTGLIGAIAGLVFLLLERLFYGDLDENGVLQESFFLPLGFLLLIAGILLFAIGTVKRMLAHKI